LRARVVEIHFSRAALSPLWRRSRFHLRSSSIRTRRAQFFGETQSINSPFILQTTFLYPMIICVGRLWGERGRPDLITCRITADADQERPLLCKELKEDLAPGERGDVVHVPLPQASAAGRAGRRPARRRGVGVRAQDRVSDLSGESEERRAHHACLITWIVPRVALGAEHCFSSGTRFLGRQLLGKSRLGEGARFLDCLRRLPHTGLWTCSVELGSGSGDRGGAGA
jgi:hypothetical protein